MDPALLSDAFARHRRFLWAVCYRMTGSGADAEDLVQETFERALRHPPVDTERDLKPWLLRVAMNASRDQLRRRKAASYPGPWLPAPVETPLDDPFWQGVESPDARYDRLESVSFAFLRAAEALTVNQRAVLLLRDVLDRSVRETADILEMSEPNVKTTLHRARAAMAGYEAHRHRTTRADRERALRVLRAFLFHLTTGNVEALRALLREDVVMLNDGAGEYHAARKPVHGIERVITFHRRTRKVHERMGLPGAPRFDLRIVNGVPAMVVSQPTGRSRLAPHLLVWIELDPAGRIAEINWVLASRKLACVSFDTLPPPSLRGFVMGLGAALVTPSPLRWLPRAFRRVLRGETRA